MRHVLATSALCALIISGSAHAQVRTLEKIVKDAGYRLYQPPRENWGPGTVFFGRVSGGKLRVDRLLCPGIFRTVTPSQAAVVLPDYTGTSDTDLSFGISLLEKVVGPDNAASLKGGYHAPRNVTVKWGPITEFSYFAASIYTPQGQLADVDPQCRAALRQVRQRGQMDRVFVIDRAINLSSLTYIFKRGNDATPSGGSVGGELKIAGLLSLNANIGATVRDESTLVVTKPIYIAYARPIKLAEFAPTADVSGTRVKVRLQRTAADLVIE